MIDQAIGEIEPMIGTLPACRALERISTSGATSGSSRIEAAISSSVIASNRTQSVRDWGCVVADCCFEAPLLTPIQPRMARGVQAGSPARQLETVD